MKNTLGVIRGERFLSWRGKSKGEERSFTYLPTARIEEAFLYSYQRREKVNEKGKGPGLKKKKVLRKKDIKRRQRGDCKCGFWNYFCSGEGGAGGLAVAYHSEMLPSRILIRHIKRERVRRCRKETWGVMGKKRPVARGET